jgi:hypothetical protein
VVSWIYTEFSPIVSQSNGTLETSPKIKIKKNYIIRQLFNYLLRVSNVKLLHPQSEADRKSGAGCEGEGTEAEQSPQVDQSFHGNGRSRHRPAKSKLKGQTW